MTALLAVRDLHVRYGGAIQALRGVDVELTPGAVVAVLGGNGAGKTTLLRAICGNLRPHRAEITGGQVVLDGKNLGSEDAATRVRLGLVQVPEGRRIFSRLTVEENLRVGLGMLNGRARAAALSQVFELFPVLAERRSQRGGLLSGGEQQMLAIGRALVTDPKVLVLDEPSLGLAPRIIGQVGELITRINAQGTSVLLVEQNATMALRVATTAIVLEQGVVRLRGSSEELRSSEQVRHLYLGHTGLDAGRAGPGADQTAARPARRPLERWAG